MGVRLELNESRRKAVCNSRLAITASSTLVRSLLVIRVVETISTEPVRFISHRLFICPVSRFKTASKVAGKGVYERRGAVYPPTCRDNPYDVGNSVTWRHGLLVLACS